MPFPVLHASALLLAALSLGLSFAHALEAPPRLRTWPAELWREVTVFNRQYLWFGIVGGPVEVLAVVATAAVAAADRASACGRLSAAAAALFLAALAVWLLVVRRANAILATWRRGPMPDDFGSVRRRWEGGHIVMSAFKLMGLAVLAVRVSLGHGAS